MKLLALSTFFCLPFLATAQNDKIENPCTLNYKLTRTDKSGVVLSESITTAVRGESDSTMSLNMATNGSPHYWVFHFELEQQLRFEVSDPKQLTSRVENGTTFVYPVDLFSGSAIRIPSETYIICCLDGETVKLTILPSAEPAGAGQPATNPTDKASAKDQTSTPTSKDAPR